MSTSAPAPQAVPTIVQKYEFWLRTALTEAEQLAMRLIGKAANAETSLAAVVAASPLAQEALKEAAADGVPVQGLEDALAAAKALADRIAAPTPPPVPAVA